MSAGQIIVTVLILAAVAGVVDRVWTGHRAQPAVVPVLAILAAVPPAILFGAVCFGSGGALPPPPALALPVTPSPLATPIGICGAQSLPAAPGPAAARNIVARRVSGEVEHSVLSPGGVAFCGWAADVRDHRPADAVIVIVNGRVAGAVAPSIDRPDVKTALGPFGERTGFSIDLPLQAVAGHKSPPRVAVLAVERGVASRLPFLCASPPNAFGC